ncbi:hypothetical protein HYR54_07240, partial [Candidatus Acetothermia bacterium]|nr:hypothetical protein [Candidatus Acetothermia bacterium]
MKFIKKNAGLLRSVRSWGALGLVLALAVVFGSFSVAYAQTPVRAAIWVDNFHIVCTGTAIAITSCSPSVVSYPAVRSNYLFSVNPNEYIYVVAWSDDSTQQGFLGKFVYANTGAPIAATGDPVIEVCATGDNLDTPTAPTNTAISAKLATCAWGSPAVGPSPPFLSWGLPPASVPGLSSARWIWHDAGPLATGSGCGDPNRPFKGDCNHQEYLIFRIPAPCCVDLSFQAGGDNDDFGHPEPSSPSPALQTAINTLAGSPVPLTAGFDNTSVNNHFGHTFVLPQGKCIEGATLEVRAKPLGDISENDGIDLGFSDSSGNFPRWAAFFGNVGFTSTVLSSPGNLLPEPVPGQPAWSTSNSAVSAGYTFILDLGSLTGGPNFITDLNSKRFLDIYIEDDTSVDYLKLTVKFCECKGGTGTGGCVKAPAGMVDWWPLGDPTGDTVVDDIAGATYNHGSPKPGPTIGPSGPASVPAVVGNGLFFPTQNTYVEVNNDAEVNFGAGSFTIDAWIKPVQVGQNIVQPIVDKFKQTSPNTAVGYRLFVTNGQLHFILADGSTCVDTPAPITYGLWQHVAAVRKGGTPTNAISVYINGVPGNTPFPSTPVVGNIDNNANLLIGGTVGGTCGPLTQFPFGEISIDELEFFNRDLMQTEIQGIFNAGSAGKCRGHICGVKFNDLNGNGKQDPGELGLSGWMIQVKDASGNVIASTVTDANGKYCIDVPIGTYTVMEVQQSGWVQTFPQAPGSYTVTVGLNQTVQDINFGNKKKEGTAEICVTKFNDLNGDGVQQLPNELGLPNWTFTVTPPPPATITTGPQGTICFGVPAPGTYTISEVLQSGWMPTVPPTGSQTVTVQPGLVNLSFGNKQTKSETAVICVTKFNDLNGNGKQDPGELGLPNWIFTVQPGSLTGTTNPKGEICFTVPAPGTYIVTEQVQSGWMLTTPNPQTVNVLPGQQMNLSFGNQQKDKREAVICVTKFNDLNGDGKQQANEPSLPGWIFTVQPGNLTGITNPKGEICFTVPAPGTYIVTE